MVRYKFFVHLQGWKDGGFIETSFSVNEAEAKKTVEKINEEYEREGKNCRLSWISSEEISDEYFDEFLSNKEED